MTGPLRLLLISYPQRLDLVFERSVLAIARFASTGFRIERCQQPREAVQLARRWQRRGHAITRLELMGHGSPGAFQLGDAMCFDARGEGLELAAQLGEHLAPAARVNLLGCRVTAHGDSRWLVPFERALGKQRTLWGSPVWLSDRAFRDGPLDAKQEAKLVRASTTTPVLPGQRNLRRPGGSPTQEGEDDGQQEAEQVEQTEVTRRQEEGRRRSRASPRRA